jgi:ribonuclease P protein subunit RPR2
MPRRRKGQERQVARTRMLHLSQLAEQMAHEGDFTLANRYVELARRLGMRYNVGLPRELRLRMCRKCGRYLLPGVNSTVRVTQSRIRTRCHHCGTISRHPYLREQRERRRLARKDTP